MRNYSYYFKSRKINTIVLSVFFILVLVVALIVSILPTTDEKKVLAQQLTEERAEAVQVATNIVVPYGSFLVSKNKIIWITQWNTKKKDVILASLESGAGVMMTGIVFNSNDELQIRSIRIIRPSNLIGMTVVQPSDCRYIQILIGINKGVYSYPNGLPKCE